MSYNFYEPSHQTISVEIKNKKIIILKGTQWEDRNDSMERLLLSIKNKLSLDKNKKFIINTGDGPINKGQYPYKVMSFSTIDGFEDIPIPCFVYDHWNGARISNWEKTVTELSRRGNFKANIDKAVWFGAPTNSIRVEASNMFLNHEDLIHFKLMNWGDVRNRKKEAIYLSLDDHLDYKILLDFPGNGFSARIYYFLFCKRPIIKFYDHHVMWFDKYLPEDTILKVKNLSEVLKITKKLLCDKNFYDKVVNNIQLFSNQYLSKEKAMEYLAEVINKLPHENDKTY
jgi:hypothetical protein